MKAHFTVNSFSRLLKLEQRERMSLLWHLLCLGTVALINGASSQGDETFKLYYPPPYQVLRDADSPVLLATYDAKSFKGVKYSTAPGYQGIPQPRQNSQQKTNLTEDIATTIQNTGYGRYRFSYNLDGLQGMITFNRDGKYDLEHLKGPALPLNTDEVARYYLSAIKNRHSPKVEVVPDTVYPEILVIVHNDIFQSLDSNVDETVKYVTEFWAKVDMRLRGLQNPKVRLNIAGIVIAQSADATSYINTENLVGVNADWHSEFNKATLYVHEQPDLKDFYDVVALMVKLPKKFVTRTRTTGLATQRATCEPAMSQHGLRHSAFMMVSDDGRYGGVHVGAHEMGHILGAPHDWEDECNRHPNLAYIMTYRKENDRILEKFSPCTTNKIRKHLNSGQVSCFYNKPNVKKSPPQTLHKQSVQEVCESALGKGAFTNAIGDKICSDYIECRETEVTETEIRTRYLNIRTKDGTICGDGKVCLMNQCVPEPLIK